jgi:hypothetical protein
MSKQRQSQSAHISSTTGSSSSQEVGAQDADMVQADQIGNEAMQQQTTGADQGTSESEGAWDWVVDKGEELLDDVLEWGAEQITSADHLRRYIEIAGEAAARKLMPQIASMAPQVLEAFVSSAKDYDDLFYTALDLLEDASLLLGLPAAAQAIALSRAIANNVVWVLNGLASIDAARLLEIIRQLDAATVQKLIANPGPLADAAMDALWPAGLGITVDMGLGGCFSSIALGASYEATFRHTGAGAIEGSCTISGEAGGEVGIGGGEAGAKAKAEFIIGAGGSITTDMAASSLASWNGAALLCTLAGGGIALVGADIAPFVQDTNWGELVTGMSIAGNVKASVGGVAKKTSDPMAQFAAGLGVALEAGGSITFSDLAGKGTENVSGRVTVAVGMEALANGALVFPDIQLECGTLKLPKLEGDFLKQGATAKMHIDYDLEADKPFADPFWEVEMNGGVAGVEGSVGLETEEMMPGFGLDAFLSNIRALNIALSLPITDGLSEDLLGSTEFHALAEKLGLEPEGTIELSMRLDGDTVAFLAENVYAVFEKASAPEKALKELMAWSLDPFGLTPSECMQLVCMELAQASHMEAMLDVMVRIENELGLEEACGTKWGAAAKLGATIDIETDLFTHGARITTNDVSDLLNRRVEAAVAAK